MAIKKSLGENPFFASSARQRLFRFLIIAIAFVFGIRLAQLQLLEGSVYRLESDSQAIKPLRVEPFRGNFYDSKSRLFVHNEPSFSVSITPNDFRPEAVPLLTSILGQDSAEIFQTLKRYKHYSPFIPIKVLRDIDFQTLALLEEYNDYLPGLDVTIESKRLYDLKANLAHVLGYTREVSADEIERQSYYNPGDVIGKTGLEKYYESSLRGKEGVSWIAVNKFGKKVSSFDNGKRDVMAVNGFDLHLSIDLELQSYAEKLLEGKRGSVVAIDPNNGEILIIASKPDFDPRDFAGKISSEKYAILRDNPGKPLLHRAINSGNPPGSTWKMLMLLAGLEEGIITPQTTFYCGGAMVFGGRSFKCHGAHGNTNARRAIEGSCNVYFYNLGLKLGIDKIIEYGKMFGFEQKTGIDLPYEFYGKLPNKEQILKQYGGKFPRGLLLNYGIGQGEILATPLQMAVYTAALANKGTIHQPHIVKEIYNNVIGKKQPVHYDSFDLPIKKEYFDIVHQGMSDVVNGGSGTAKRAQVHGIEVCGKTGTAQNPGKDHAWFLCFAPRKNPKIAMVVFVENAGFGGSISAPIAQKLLSAFFYPETMYAPKNQIIPSDSTQVPDSTNIPQEIVIQD